MAWHILQHPQKNPDLIETQHNTLLSTMPGGELHSLFPSSLKTPAAISVPLSNPSHTLTRNWWFSTLKRVAGYVRAMWTQLLILWMLYHSKLCWMICVVSLPGWIHTPALPLPRGRGRNCSAARGAHSLSNLSRDAQPMWKLHWRTGLPRAVQMWALPESSPPSKRVGK